jgi:hypothetical protein
LRNWSAVANGIEAHLDRLKAEVIKGGELRQAMLGLAIEQREHGRRSGLLLQACGDGVRAEDVATALAMDAAPVGSHMRRSRTRP